VQKIEFQQLAEPKAIRNSKLRYDS